ncbi:orotate phosphoribosyltransferase [Acidilobus sp.]|jgi:orotate phosphoribosyltransferase|uniref:orotate phosphoribosyltransferase n=1 Tax=Acidilobus sp. TaxID=1872109 RepID=UPI003D01D960
MSGIIERLLLNTGAVLFGEFRLTSGRVSHVYIDLRKVIGHPEAFRMISLELTHKVIEDVGGCGNCAVVGIATGGVPWATAVALSLGLPLAYIRQPKGHGTEKDLEGAEVKGMTALLIDDVATTGSSLSFGVSVLRSHGAGEVIGAVIVDREQGARRSLESMGVKLLSVTTLRNVLEEARKLGMISDEQLNSLAGELWGTT